MSYYYIVLVKFGDFIDLKKKNVSILLCVVVYMFLMEPVLSLKSWNL